MRTNCGLYIYTALIVVLGSLSSCQWLPEVGKVSLSESSVTLKVGGSKQLTAIVEPAAAEYEGITWTSSDPSVVSVANGQLSARKLGTATITASTEGVTSSPCTVTVEATKVTGVTINKYSMELTEGESASLTATVSPSNATDPSVSWSSSDRNVATVSSGYVSAVASGKAIITVRTNDGGYTAICEVTVKAKFIPVSGVTISSSTLSLKPGETSQLTATVAPSNATNKDVSWSSSNTSVATVASDGTVTAIAPGTATITVTTADQGKSATCLVTVNAIPVSKIMLSNTSLTLTEGDSSQLTATVAPSNATNKDVVWTSSNTSVATVSSNGVVIAKNTGSAVVSCTSSSGVHDNCYVFVYAAANIQSPLTFEVITDGIIYLDASEGIAIGMGKVNPLSLMVEYQKNNNPWEKIYVDDTHLSDKISVTKGDIVRFRGNNKSYSSMTIADNNDFSIRAMKFRSSSLVSISGNIMSLIDKDNYKNLSQIAENGAFAMLFKNLEVISAERLYLPTKLSKYCYYNMFNGCKTLVSPPMLASDKLESRCYWGMFANCISLIEAPVLPAKSLVRDCYRGMFEGCSALNRIEANFDTKPSSNYTYYWVFGVNPSGRFYKSHNSNWDVKGIHGIPEGWDIVEQ